MGMIDRGAATAAAAASHRQRLERMLELGPLEDEASRHAGERCFSLELGPTDLESALGRASLDQTHADGLSLDAGLGLAAAAKPARARAPARPRAKAKAKAAVASAASAEASAAGADDSAPVAPTLVVPPPVETEGASEGGGEPSPNLERVDSCVSLASSAGGKDKDGHRKEWAAWEDEAIRNGVERMGARWRVIAAELPGRSDDAVRNRWSRLQQCSNGSKPASAPRVRKDTAEQRQSWTATEDEIIVSSVREFGHRWNRIAERLPKRTEHAIRNRWHRLQMRAIEGGGDGSTSASPATKRPPAAATVGAPPVLPAVFAAQPPLVDAVVVGKVPDAMAADVSGYVPSVLRDDLSASAHDDDDDELEELPTGFDFDAVIAM